MPNFKSPKPAHGLDDDVPFFEGKSDVVIGTLHFTDRRLERALGAIFNESKALLWDADRNGYEVDLSIANPPHLVTGRRPGQQNDDAAPEEQDDTIETELRTANPGAPLTISANPKWRGTDTGYKSYLGWALDHFEDRGEERLPRGERGKHWRLTHVDADLEIWYKNKKLATDDIISGAAQAAIFA